MPERSQRKPILAKLLDIENNQKLNILRIELINEAEQLTKIFGSIITKAK